MIKKIEIPYYLDNPMQIGSKSINMAGAEMKAFIQAVRDVNQAIENGVEVSGAMSGAMVSQPFGQVGKVGDTHKALLIGVEPIKQESCADVLAEILEKHTGYDLGTLMYKRAKAALEREDKK